jgi:drug/metabolite transporter (DMT)-like permease
MGLEFWRGLAFAVLGERLDPGQLLGGTLILVAVISLARAAPA